jgi:hypothetical protein
MPMDLGMSGILPISDFVRNASAQRHALARESAAFPVEIRCPLSGKGRSAFGMLHHIRGGEVQVLPTPRPSQDLMNPE